MNEKNNGSKKKARGLPRSTSTAGRGKRKSSLAKGAYFVSDVNLSALVSNQKPRGAALTRSFATFDEAKSAAVDSLLQAIEEAERQLLVLKRATSYEAWSGVKENG